MLARRREFGFLLPRFGTAFGGCSTPSPAVVASGSRGGFGSRRCLPQRRRRSRCKRRWCCSQFRAGIVLRNSVKRKSVSFCILSSVSGQFFRIWILIFFRSCRAGARSSSSMALSRTSICAALPLFAGHGTLRCRKPLARLAARHLALQQHDDHAPAGPCAPWPVGCHFPARMRARR